MPKKTASKDAPKKHRIFAIPFASVYPLYLEKAAKKGRTKEEVDAIIAWLTGYKGQKLQLMQQIRYLDKLIDELAKGKKLESILRK